MKQKQLIRWLVLILALLVTVFNWLHSERRPQTPAQTGQNNATQVQKPRQQEQSAVDFDYDFVMRNDAIGQNKQAKTDYYMLALSWSPAFCQTQQQRYGDNLPQSAQLQCGTQRQYGWVIHGLWPQNANARSVSDHPRFCQGDLPAVDYAILQPYLAESPSANLLQGEWEKHGACAFKQPEQYFKKQQDLYRSLRLPTQEMNKKELFRWLKQHNPQLKNAYLGASREELFICYDLNWQVIDCK